MSVPQTVAKNDAPAVICVVVPGVFVYRFFPVRRAVNIAFDYG